MPPNGHREWAELDDDDDGPAFASSAVTMAVPKLEEEISIATAEEATTTLVQEDEMAVETPGLDPVFEPPTGVENPEHSQGISTTTSAPIRTGQSAAVPSRLRAASGRGQQTPKQREPTTVLDADGFEMKVKRPSTQAFRGRGGRGGGDGERGRGGYSRGRDGRGGGSAPQAQYKSMRKDGQPGEAMGTGQSIPLTRSKNIFKDVQPSGPKSAPVI